MNQRNLNSWEIRFGFSQAIALSGLILGSLCCAFYLGFLSGRTTGFESAMSSSATSLARLPIKGSVEDEQLDSELVSRMYAKLRAEEVERELPPVPELDAIKDTKEFPLLEAIDALEVSEKRRAPVAEEKRVYPVKAEQPTETSRDLGKTLAELEAEQSVDTPSVTKTVAASNSSAEKASEKVTVAKREKDEAISTVAAETQISKKNMKTPESKALTEAKPQSETVIAKKQSAPDSVARAALNPGAITSATNYSREKESWVQRRGELEKRGNTKIEKLAREPKAKSARTETAKIAPRRLPENSLSRGWYAQVAAPSELRDAEQLSQKLRRSGFRVKTESANVRGQQYFRVLVGPEENRTLGERLLSQVKRESYVTSDPFLRLVR